MILKLEFDLSDIFSEGEDRSVNEMVINQIVSSLRREALSRISEETKDQILMDATKFTNKMVSDTVTSIVADYINKPEVLDFLSTKVSIKDYIEKRLNELVNDNNIKSFLRDSEDMIKKELDTRLKAMTDELKNRYDMVFASQLISKMKDANMLNEQAMKALVDGK